MSAIQQDIPNSSPLQRSVFLITFIECDASGLTKPDFAKVIVNAWKSCYRSKVLQ